LSLLILKIPLKYPLMLRGKYKTYDRLFVYILRNFHPELRNLKDEDLIGVWEEDGVGVLFFHVEKDELVKRLVKDYDLILEEKDVIRYEEWTEKRFPQPFKVGNLKIAPIWVEGDWDIVIDPSVVFGEGSHPTTSTVLELSWKFYQEFGLPERVIDLGCGTGVLSLFWAKLGAEVVAVDKNPLCVEVTRHNAKLNGLENKINVVEGDVKEFLPVNADLVLANLFKGILLELFGLSSFWKAPYYIVSGFSPAMEEELIMPLSGFKIELSERVERNGWVTWFLKNPKGKKFSRRKS